MNSDDGLSEQAREYGLTNEDFPLVMTPKGPERMMTVRAAMIWLFTLDLNNECAHPKGHPTREAMESFQHTARLRFQMEQAVMVAPRKLAQFLFEDFGGKAITAEIDKACGLAPGPSKGLIEVILDYVAYNAVPEG